MNRKLVLFSSSVAILGLVFSLGLTMNSQDNEIVGISQGYTFAAIEPEELKELATSVVSGTIIDKKQVIDIRETETSEGKIADELLRIPSQIYTIQTNSLTSISGVSTPATFEVKMRGGEVNGLTWNAGFADYSVGDELLLILDKDKENSFYEPVSAFFGVYQIEDGMAIGQEKQFTEQVLLEKLQ